MEPMIPINVYRGNEHIGYFEVPTGTPEYEINQSVNTNYPKATHWERL